MMINPIISPTIRLPIHFVKTGLSTPVIRTTIVIKKENNPDHLWISVHVLCEYMPQVPTSIVTRHDIVEIIPETKNKTQVVFEHFAVLSPYFFVQIVHYFIRTIATRTDRKILFFAIAF